MQLVFFDGSLLLFQCLAKNSLTSLIRFQSMQEMLALDLYHKCHTDMDSPKMNKELVKEGYEIQLNIVLAKLSINGDTNGIGASNLVRVFSVQFLLFFSIQIFVVVMMLMLMRVMVMVMMLSILLRLGTVSMRSKPPLRDGKTGVKNSDDHWLLGRSSCCQSLLQRKEMTTCTDKINTIQEPGNIIIVHNFKLNLFSNKDTIVSEQSMSVFQGLQGKKIRCWIHVSYNH